MGICILKKCIYKNIYIYLLVNPQRQHNAKVSWGYRIKPSTKTMATMKQIIPRVGIQVSYCRNEVVCFLQMFVMRKKNPACGFCCQWS